MSKEEDMKRLNNEEMKNVNGGVSSYRTSAVCEGFDNNVHAWHSVVITGSGSTQKAMKDDYNSKLKAHKNNAYYKNFSHSAQPL